MPASLFRSEARDSRATSWLGTIVLMRPVPTLVMTGAASLVAFAVLAFLLWGESNNKARVTGFLTPTAGVARAVATQAGVVESRYVAEGDAVSKGMPLVVITDPRATDDRRDLGAQVAWNLKERQRALTTQRELAGAAFEAELQSFSARRSRAVNEALRLGDEITAMRTRVALSGEEAERTESLERSGFLSRSMTDRKRDETLDLQIRLSSLERARSAAQREQSGVEAEGDSARARYLAQVAALDGQKAALAQERLERGAAYRTVVTAPQSGVVASLLVEPGQTVAQGAALLTILPNDLKLEAHLFAPSRSIGFVRAGQPVLLRYPAFPSQKFGSQRAQIIAVSRNALSPGDLGFNPPDGNREALYRIRATLDAQQVLAYGKAEDLQAGMLVEADILLDRRRLIEWIFDPLLSLTGRL